MAKSKIKIFVFHEKHGDRYIHIPSEEKKLSIAKKIFLEREAEGWYDEEGIEKKHLRFYEEALKPDDGTDADKEAAMTFLNLRSKYEYEGFEIVNVEEL